MRYILLLIMLVFITGCNDNIQELKDFKLLMDSKIGTVCIDPFGVKVVINRAYERGSDVLYEDG